MPLRDRINDELKDAMRAGDAKRRDALRLLTAALKQREVDERKALADADVLSVIEKMMKQRRDAIEQFRQGGRDDLAEKEEFEVAVLQRYMPAAMSDEEVESAINDAIMEAGAKGPADMGKVMAVVKGKIAGRAEMAKVSARVKQKLAG